jgi:5-methyltetrahydrofolate--homocysteine methyltransferase
MRRPLLERLKDSVLLCDGAMGTQLDAHGIQPGECHEGWNVAHPEKVKEIQRAYLEAGAEAILTNTFGGSRWCLDRYGLGEKVGEFNSAAVKLAREVAGEERYVLGDVGPTAQFMYPLGEKTEAEFVAVFAEQVSFLAEGSDAIAVQTMTALEELVAAVRAAKETGLPVIASMAFQPEVHGKGFRTIMGVGIEDMVRRLEEEDVDALGANCGTVDIADMVEIVRQMKELTSLPVLAEANAGKPRIVSEKTVFDQTPEDMAAYIPALVDAGVNIVGGCCGTTPEHIRVFAERINRGRR